MQHSGIAQSKMALYHPRCFLQKVLNVKAPRDLHTLAISQVSSKEKTKTTMVTKKLDFESWTLKISKECS
jgi:hypothetical protein